MKSRKPIVYIASPYTKGDVALNTHYQCKIFDMLMNDDKVVPIAPLWSHFQHTLFPRPYRDWMTYNLSLLPLYDACLRLDVELEMLGYRQKESSGADAEEQAFQRLNRPVFHSVEALYQWVEEDFSHE